MNDTIRFFLFFIILWILQGAALYYQNRKIKKRIQEFQAMGDLCIGVHKNRFGGKVFCFFIINDGIVKKGVFLKGLTIFSKFEELDILEGQPVENLKEKISDIKEISESKNIYSSLLDALDKYEKKNGKKKNG